MVTNLTTINIISVTKISQKKSCSQPKIIFIFKKILLLPNNNAYNSSFLNLFINFFVLDTIFVSG